MLSAEHPTQLTQAFIDSEIRECPGLAPYYAAAVELGKIKIVDEKVVDNGTEIKN